MDAKAMLTVLEPSDFNFCKDVWSVIVQFIPTLQLAKFRAINKLFQRLVTTEMHKRCVTLDNPVSIAQLLDFAYQECILSHVTYQGREYYPCDTYWCERSLGLPERDYDPNLKCEASCFEYDLERFLQRLGQPDKQKWCDLREAGTSNQQLMAIFKKLPQMCPFYFHTPTIPSNPEQIMYHFDVADPNAMGYVRERFGKAIMVFQRCSLVYLPHTVQLINNAGVNDDHRGRNHLNIELDWHGEYTIPAGIHSVYNIVQSCFRIKGNKFENNYEHFGRIFDADDFDSENSEDMEELLGVVDFDGSEWIVTPSIGHGS
jgi:hypothetical protein